MSRKSIFDIAAASVNMSNETDRITGVIVGENVSSLNKKLLKQIAKEEGIKFFIAKSDEQEFRIRIEEDDSPIESVLY